MIESVLSKIIFTWIILIVSLITYVISYQRNNLFQFGPNPDLLILGIVIDTTEKYTGVVLFCFLNSAVRTIHHNIIQSWIINTIQDSKSTAIIQSNIAYEITLISTTFIWFDFFMYMNIVMSQIDMFLIETGSDLVMTTMVTTYYLREKEKDAKLNHKENLITDISFT